MNKKLSLCITSYNRCLMTLECIEDVKDDPFLDEIVIVDDASDIYIFNELKEACDKIPKVKLYRNEVNLDCYANKAKAVSLASNSWVILFDSDNIMTKEYIDKIYEQVWNEDTILAPTWAQPTFDYREFSGWYVMRENVADLIDLPMFATALNTHNMFVHRDRYLECFDANKDPNTSDSIFMNTQWLERGGRIHFVEGLHYFHRIHNESHYIKNSHKGDMNNDLIEKLRKMR